MRKALTCALLCTLVFYAEATNARGAASSQMYDVVIYGGTSAGVAAAIQAKRMGKTAIGSEGQSKNWESNLSATRT